MSVSLERPSGSQSLSKDIFISYSRRDRAWVNDYLIRLLTAADLTFTIDDRDFPVGGLIDESIRQGVQHCRYTLLVMTPDWVKGKWTHYESLLAIEQDPDAVQRRVLALKLKNCDVPAHISPRLFLDLCEIRRRDAEMEKLLKQLGVPEDGIQRAKESVAQKTLQLLIELMDEPGVREEVSKLREMFVQIAHRNNAITSNKTLHDYLQAAQLTVRQVARSSRELASSPGKWRDVRAGTSALRQGLKKLSAFTATAKLEPVEVLFAKPLARLADDIQLAFESSDARRFTTVLELIANEIDRALPLVNDRVIQKVRDRPLEDLIENLRNVYDLVANFEFDETASRLLAEFRRGIEILHELDQAIRDWVDDHSLLQQTEVTLNLMTEAGEPTLYRISTYWGYVEPLIRQLKDADRYPKLFLHCDRVCHQLADSDCVRDADFEEQVTYAFSNFIEEAAFAFNELDIDLRGVCEQLEGHGAELQEIIGRMQSHETDD